VEVSLEPRLAIDSARSLFRTEHVTIHHAHMSFDTLVPFAKKVDAAVSRISSFLGCDPPPLIEIELIAKRRISMASHNRQRIVISKDRLPDRTAIVHELTHLIGGLSYQRGGVLDEGLAVYLQERFGGPDDRSFPTAGRDLHCEAVRMMIQCNCVHSLLSGGSPPRQLWNGPQRALLYLQAGSLVRFLIETYGIASVMRLYRGSGTWSEVCGTSAEALERDWIDAMSKLESGHAPAHLKDLHGLRRSLPQATDSAPQTPPAGRAISDGSELYADEPNDPNAERVVYINGDFVAERHATVSVMDWGFSGGDAVFEVTRTFGHRPFRLQEHLARLRRSLAYLRIEQDSNELSHAALSTLEQNVGLLGPNDEYAIWQVSSRGDRRAGPDVQSTFVCYCLPIEFERFARRYINGSVLVTPATRRIPPGCVSPLAKLTSRANQLVAAFEARLYGPKAVPLLLDVNGFVAETNAANFFFVSGSTLLTARRCNVLEGITRASVMSLARDIGLRVEEGDFTPHDVYGADEAFTTGTTESIVPVRSLNGVDIGSSVPGPITMRLMKAWNELVGLDVVQQALSHVEDGQRGKLLAKWQSCLALADAVPAGQAEPYAWSERRRRS
jgi:branched-chain amino acid aminotransferase